jgi:hypothetical protein
MAGASAGCRTILMGDGCGKKSKARLDATVGSLNEAADLILKQPATKQD